MARSWKLKAESQKENKNKPRLKQQPEHQDCEEIKTSTRLNWAEEQRGNGNPHRVYAMLARRVS